MCFKSVIKCYFKSTCIYLEIYPRERKREWMEIEDYEKKKKRKKKYAIIYVILFYNFYYEWNYMEMEKCIMIHLCSNEKNLNFIGNFISV